MKKLELNKEIKADVVLPVNQEGICNFCGEGKKKTIGGHIGLKVLVPVYKDIGVRKLIDTYDTEIVVPFLGEPYRIVKNYHGLDWKYVCERTGELTTREDKASICLDCIKQLYNLTK